MIPRDKKVILNPSLVLREEFDEWAILFDPDENKVFALNPTSVFICRHLDGRHTIEDIVGRIKEEFDEVSQDVEGHVNDFINDLICRGYAVYEDDTVRG
ncbi:MAG: hypothetical protein Fur0020_10180 [Thermodesulfovibrionia bacterium]